MTLRIFSRYASKYFLIYKSILTLVPYFVNNKNILKIYINFQQKKKGQLHFVGQLTGVFI
ncbi:hypothetical protein J25TS5_31630 [Paenibacillus faecis]|nr:hypothetical protein J25TS5_31630 [Paenibacillus faecis]